MRFPRNSTALGLAVVVVCALLFAGYGALEGLLRGRGSPAVAQYVASFACFGFLFGAVLAFDPLPDAPGPDLPILRTVLGAIAGLALAFVWGWSNEALALTVLVAAALGYTGTTWAKYV